ncbi:kinase [Lithospermum erythrorhizon]|uniref:Kinase n=1 Tax=Lithospermum erythrorhizon TaxID=34254 RepID=A0AAV3RR08_LITER
MKRLLIKIKLQISLILNDNNNLMDRNENGILKENSCNEESSILTSNMFLNNTGEVVLTHNSIGLSWDSTDPVSNDQEKSCLGIKLIAKRESSIRFSDMFAVELIGCGSKHESALADARGCFLCHSSKMYRFSVHCVQKSKAHHSMRVASVYTFSHKDLHTCQMWIDLINNSLNKNLDKPKSLLVFVNPMSGKGNGCSTWESVAPIFSHAKVKTKVTVTQRAAHAFDVMASISNEELKSYDGVVAVGGDGFFGEILNGLLLSRHKASYPPRPTQADNLAERNGTVMDHVAERASSVSTGPCEDESPLLTNTGNGRVQETNLEQAPEFSFPNERFRFGIIPAGSTDAIVICTTGARDPITSALQIVLGKRLRIDIAQVVRWKATSTSKEEPSMRYAASFAGYGFYGDVITESEKYRWMGPKRYDFAGTKVFLRHSSYEAEVEYLELEPENESPSSEGSSVGRKKGLWRLSKKSDKVPCRANCDVCNLKVLHSLPSSTSSVSYSQDSRWKRTRGRFLSVGGAVISCRNEKAPDGLVADAHLSDGFLHLILIKDCPRAYYLWHLTQLTVKGGHPLEFDFVEHHKTPAFTFTSLGKQSMWNVDGEIFQAHQLSAQVFRGLINLFATGPEV